MNFYLIISTINSKDKGVNIAKNLIEKKLAACVNIIPNIISVYEWEGKTEISNEYLLLIKTVENRLKEAIKEIKENHDYELPEIISFKIDNGDKNYLKWIKDKCGGKKWKKEFFLP